MNDRNYHPERGLVSSVTLFHYLGLIFFFSEKLVKDLEGVRSSSLLFTVSLSVSLFFLSNFIRGFKHMMKRGGP